MVRPLDDPEVPWSVLVVGLWIPNFFYWGLNQYITQRTLGSRSLAEGQKGIVFAALLKLLIPFVVVIPGILAFNLFSADLEKLADIKNAPVIEQFNADRDVIFELTEAFAERYPGMASSMVARNATRVGTRAGEATPARLAELNAEQVRAAREKGRVISQKLVGYDYDAAFPTLLRNLLPMGNGLRGFVLAAIFGAVVSSLASMLNSAATIATMDIYNKLRKRAGQYELVTVGRLCTVAFVLIAILIAPELDSPRFGGIFTFIQEFQGFISPGILAIFLFGLLIHRAPRAVGTVGLVLNPILYGLFKYSPAIPGLKDVGVMGIINRWSFLDRMALSFAVVLLVLTIMTLIKPLAKPVVLPVNPKMDVTTSKGAMGFGVVVVVATLLLYTIFW